MYTQTIINNVTDSATQVAHKFGQKRPPLLVTIRGILEWLPESQLFTVCLCLEIVVIHCMDTIFLFYPNKVPYFTSKCIAYYTEKNVCVRA